jgi:spore coat polysaccharide biosynthesis protein SpsF (cytidylyltransferase family)
MSQSVKKISVLIQARTGSSRLPNKVLANIEQKQLIWHVINRVKKIKSVEQIALITSQLENDKILLDIAQQNGILGFAGDELDVLDRHYQCALKINADPIIRITSDCPLLDPFLVEEMLQIFLKNKYDYVSNVTPPTFPDGLDVEIFSFKALEKTFNEAKLMSEREHVTPYISKNPNKFKLFNFKNSQDLSHLRWTVDRDVDLDLIQKIYSKMSPKTVFGMDDILKVLKSNPELLKINNHISRNEGYVKSLKNDEKLPDSNT